MFFLYRPKKKRMMSVLKRLRQTLIQNLWQRYLDTTPQMQVMKNGLAQQGISKIHFDHFAIIDLPGPHTGIPTLSKIFSAIGYTTKGNDYLADKQNDFLWMAESDSAQSNVYDVLPQVVVADFRLSEMPSQVQTIIEKYASKAATSPMTELMTLVNRVHDNDTQAIDAINKVMLAYLKGRDWPLPSIKEFQIVHDFNELLAWVLVFGRRPNHFTLSIHLQNHFADLAAFLNYVEDDLQLHLNVDGGLVKGGPKVGIAQASTNGIAEDIQLADGYIKLPTGFIEFVWRYPKATVHEPKLWNDYFTGFIAQHADHVIESLTG